MDSKQQVMTFGVESKRDMNVNERKQKLPLELQKQIDEGSRRTQLALVAFARKDPVMFRKVLNHEGCFLKKL